MDDGYEDSYEREEKLKRKQLDLHEKQLSIAEKALSQNSPTMPLNPEQAGRLSQAVETMNALRDERRMCADIAASLLIERPNMTVFEAVKTAHALLEETSMIYSPFIIQTKGQISSILSEVRNGDSVGNSKTPV